MDTRDVALTVLLDIETNQTFSNIALGNALRKNQFTDKVERAFLSRLVEGVTETKLRLDYVIDQYSKTKIKKCKPVAVTRFFLWTAYRILPRAMNA